MSDALDFSTKKKKKGKIPPATEEKPADTPPELEFGAKKKKPKAAPVITDAPVGGDDAGADVLDFGAKKKKKGAVKPLADENSDPVDQVADQLDEFAFAGKKKKLKKDIDDFELKDGDDVPEVSEQPAYGYSYDMLLSRVFSQIQESNPELMSDQKRRLVMAPPCMARVGTKKTQFTNFNQICRSLNRDPAHLSAYMFAELGTTGSLDANGALLIRGKYQSKHIEPLLKNYARTYVRCSTCQSPETDLSKDSRLLFLQCRRCGSRITVKNVTSGFQAVTGKRAAMRAKAQ